MNTAVTALFGLMLSGEALVLAFLVWTTRIRMSLKMDWGLSMMALGLGLAGVATLEGNVCDTEARMMRLFLIGGGGMLFTIAMVVWGRKQRGLAHLDDMEEPQAIHIIGGKK